MRKILHVRNGREYRLPELPNMSVDGICPETRKVYEFSAVIFTNIPAKHFVTSLLRSGIR